MQGVAISSPLKLIPFFMIAPFSNHSIVSIHLKKLTIFRQNAFTQQSASSGNFTSCLSRQWATPASACVGSGSLRPSLLGLPLLFFLPAAVRIAAPT